MLIIAFNTEFFPVNRPGPHLHFLGGSGNKTSHMLEDRGQYIFSQRRATVLHTERYMCSQFNSTQNAAC